jgi:hypothetical protein
MANVRLDVVIADVLIAWRESGVVEIADRKIAHTIAPQ